MSHPHAFLFIGGDNNGTRHAVPDLPYARLPIRRDGHIEFEEFRKEKIFGSDWAVEFYVARGAATQWAIEQLLLHYHPPQE